MRKTSSGYYLQLDGIRFIAVLLVLVDHLLASVNVIPLGPLGVTIFFVLSGFLITGILMKSRDKNEGVPGGFGRYLKKFYIRRTLRIFPIYYITIALLYYFDVPPVRDTVAWCLLYATNIWIGINQAWMGSIDHFWSLAVEEQVYIFMPFLIFLTPRKWFVHTFFLMSVFSVLLRLYFHLAGYDWVVPYVTMPACLDAFGLGAYMAWLQINKTDKFVKYFSNPIGVIVTLVAWIGVVYWAKTFPEVHNIANNVWERLVSSIFAFFLIGNAVVGYRGVMQWVLENPVSVYLGKISYGLYLYHNFVYNHYHSGPTHPTVRLMNKIYHYVPALSNSLFFEFVLLFSLTVIVASISWFLIEKPINALKDRYAK